MVDELIHEGVGLRCYAHCDFVLTCTAGDGNQVGHRLANARAGFNNADVTLTQACCDLVRHGELLGAFLVSGVHRSQNASRGESLVNTAFVAERKWDIVCIWTWR